MLTGPLAVTLAVAGVWMALVGRGPGGHGAGLGRRPGSGYSHPVWAKPIQFLAGAEHVTNQGFRCGEPACDAEGRPVYRSAAAEARQVKGSGYGLDVVVRIGHLRFTEHRTREEIWRAVRAETPVRLSERHVQNLLEVYLALLRASEQDVAARVAGTIARAHGWLLTIARCLEPPGAAPLESPPRGAVVRARVEGVLDDLTTRCQTEQVAGGLRPKVEHLVTVLRRLGDGLYHCYDVPALPRTNNASGQVSRRVKTEQRRITGRTRADAFVVRVGGFAVYATAASATADAALRAQLATVPAAAWHQARVTLRANQARQTKMRRFRLHREAYLAALETRWLALAQPP